MKICTQCHQSKSETEFASKYAICKSCYAKNTRAKYHASKNYTADNIKILTSKDFDFSLAHDLAHEYNKPIIFIQRGLEACRRANIDKKHFIDKYLKHNDVPISELFNATYRDILRECPDIGITPD